MISVHDFWACFFFFSSMSEFYDWLIRTVSKWQRFRQNLSFFRENQKLFLTAGFTALLQMCFSEKRWLQSFKRLYSGLTGAVRLQTAQNPLL